MIEFKNLTVTACGARIIDQLDLTLPDKGTAMILGPSGCGKTTLLKSAIRDDLEDPDVQVEGSIRLRGEEIRHRKLPVHRLRQRVGMVMQHPVPFPGTAFENVTFALRCTTKLGREEIEKRALHALEEVGLERQHWETPAECLSGGQLKRLSIARTIALEPEVILLDEPSNGLDPLAAARIEKLISTLALHRLVVVVTHDVGLVHRIGDEVYFLWPYPNGCRLVEQGPAQQVLENPSKPETRLFVRAAREGASALAHGEELVAGLTYEVERDPCGPDGCGPTRTAPTRPNQAERSTGKESRRWRTGP
jgi:phosphate transport system ATP-binding protein